MANEGIVIYRTKMKQRQMKRLRAAVPIKIAPILAWSHIKQSVKVFMVTGQNTRVINPAKTKIKGQLAWDGRQKEWKEKHSKNHF